MSNRIVDGVELKKESIELDKSWSTQVYYNGTYVSKPYHKSAYVKVQASKRFDPVYHYPFKVIVDYNFKNYPAKDFYMHMNLNHIGIDDRLSIENFEAKETSTTGDITDIIVNEKYNISNFSSTYGYRVRCETDVGTISNVDIAFTKFCFMENNALLYNYEVSENYEYKDGNLYVKDDDKKIDVCVLKFTARPILRVVATKIDSKYQKYTNKHEYIQDGKLNKEYRTYEPSPAIKWDVYYYDFNSSSNSEKICTIISDNYKKITTDDGETLYVGSDLTESYDLSYDRQERTIETTIKYNYTYNFNTEYIDDVGYYMGNINSLKSYSYRSLDGERTHSGMRFFCYLKTKTIWKQEYNEEITERTFEEEKWVNHSLGGEIKTGEYDEDNVPRQIYVTSESKMDFVSVTTLLDECNALRRTNDALLYYNDLKLIGAI